MWFLTFWRRRSSEYRQRTRGAEGPGMTVLGETLST